MAHAPARSSVSVLFACRDNGGLSLLAEALANGRAPRLRAFSAGVSAAGAVDLAAVECLHAARVPADGLSAKPLELFTFSGAPKIDVVVSLVESVEKDAQRFAERSRCAVHHRWGFEDVAAIMDTHVRRLAYRRLLPDLTAAIGALGRDWAFAA
ncbi:hypothetical protein ABLE91_26245 [Aquabacter sp. CN5-332]|uniref:arsenate reductase/protein-tyrosine-phosphatase family protein n=1 Tax=Aquabacter sp. CN5-332 TaxID=3156608 RepID=UPI0032B31BD2